MKRDDLNELAAFVEVADAMSFTRAASKLGMSPSALSHAIKALEARLGLRLLTRTTRSVSTTEAGERLLKTLRPAFAEISAELAALNELRTRPAGTIRITTPRHAAFSVLWPMLPSFLAEHPDIRVEVSIDENLTDIVEGRYDAGIRFGENLAKDMIAMPIGPELQPAVVAAPEYLAHHPAPKVPTDLSEHRCINYRFGTSGTLYPWEFEKNGQAVQVKVEGPLVFNDGDLVLAAALAGQGLAYLFEDQVRQHLADGKLVRVLSCWCARWPGYYLYYPSRRKPPALSALVDRLRMKGA